MKTRRDPDGRATGLATLPTGSHALWVGVDESWRVIDAHPVHFARMTRVRFPDGAIHPVHPVALRPMAWGQAS